MPDGEQRGITVKASEVDETPFRPFAQVSGQVSGLIAACRSPVLDRPRESRLHSDGEQRNSAPLPLPITDFNTDPRK